MHQRHVLQIFGLFVLPDFAATQQVPTVIGGYFVKPCREGARFIVLAQLVAQLHENFHRGVFGVLTGGQRPAAKAEDGGGIFAIEITPGLGIACPGPCDGPRRFYLARRAHPLWSRRIHRLVRSTSRKTYTDGDGLTEPSPIGVDGILQRADFTRILGASRKIRLCQGGLGIPLGAPLPPVFSQRQQSKGFTSLFGFVWRNVIIPWGLSSP